MEDYGSIPVWKSPLPQVDQAVGNGYPTPRRGGESKPERERRQAPLSQKIAIPKKREVYNTLVPKNLKTKKKTLHLNMYIIYNT